MDSLRGAALRAAEGRHATAAEIGRVAALTSPEAARWAFTQWGLRARAAAKYARASEMLFTREALEQATHEVVARYRASRFPAGAEVADLTCGIGGDLLALAARGPAVGYELDTERAACARHNLEVYGLTAEVHLADGLAAAQRHRYAIADPARRVAGRRTLDPTQFEPDPKTLATLMRGMELAALKLSPMLEDKYLEALGGSVEFVTHDGECREACVWLGAAAEAGRWAVDAASGERLAATEMYGAVDDPGTYVFEADPAAIRAHALGTLAGALALEALGDSNGYLTGAQPVQSPWLRAYAVHGHGAWDLKRVGRLLDAGGWGTPVVKVRACRVEPETTRRALRRDGRPGAIVIAYPVGKQIRFCVATAAS